jgi:oligoribonuclease (3'-5' exoribonuclease)
MGNGQQISLYVDNVVMFLHPQRDELALVKEVLNIFGTASGLVTNIRKSSVTLIRCQDQDVEVVQTTMPCTMVNFPCRYLGLPLLMRKLSKNDFFVAHRQDH